MTTCKNCDINITWPENYIKGQRPTNLDGSIHFCVSTKSSNIIPNQTSIIPLPEIVDGHTKLFVKLIQRIESLEKRIDKE